MSKTAIKQYIQKRYDTLIIKRKDVNVWIDGDDKDKEINMLTGALDEINNFASNFGVKLKKKE